MTRFCRSTNKNLRNAKNTQTSFTEAHDTYVKLVWCESRRLVFLLEHLSYVLLQSRRLVFLLWVFY